MVSMNSLTRIQFRQFSKARKSEIIGRLFIVAYLWLFIFIVFFLTEDYLKGVPPVLIALLLLSVTIPDFLIKLIVEPDSTVMDAFLKTRPITQEKWDKFLCLSQFWQPANMEMPLIMIPPCLLCLPLFSGISTIISLYLLSVLGGIIVMLIKHRGSYQSEKEVGVSRHIQQRTSPTRYARFGLQYRSLIRSRRLKTQTLVFAALFLLQYILNGLSGDENNFANFYLYLYSFSAAVFPQQFGMGVEANFFGAIWTKPIRISQILSDKYWMGVVLEVIATLICLPFCLWCHTPLLILFGFALFCGGFTNLMALVDAYNCIPFDMFGKTFFNYQGAAASFRAKYFLTTILTATLGSVIFQYVSLPITLIIFSVLGVVGLSLHRPFFKKIEKTFLKNRYYYMEKYFEK